MLVKLGVRKGSSFSFMLELFMSLKVRANLSHYFQLIAIQAMLNLIKVALFYVVTMI
jgi:hypothetical protein